MGRLIRHGSRRRRVKKLLVPAGVVAALAVAGGSYLYSESGKVTLVTKEETTIDEFSDKLGVDSDDLRRWNKKLDEELSEGVEVVAKIDLDKEEDQQEYTIQGEKSTKIFSLNRINRYSSAFHYPAKCHAAFAAGS